MTRFAFGANWRDFLEVLDDERIREAERSLRAMLQVETLEGSSFLDIGSGSGLFSLAARRLGASPVRSFDYDRDSVACTRELRRRFFPEDETWTVERGSVLDGEYVRSLGRFDIVYSWGVLHHTGDLKRALELAAVPVKPGGKLYIALYDDRGWSSRLWTRIKKAYNTSPGPVRPLFLAAATVWFEARATAGLLLRGENPLSLSRWTEKKRRRGMSRWHDIKDWVGGYPFEVARPEEVFDFYRTRGFELIGLTTASGHGNNEFVFRKEDARDGSAPGTAPDRAAER